jgi:hemoglobin-like flavoprotein
MSSITPNQIELVQSSFRIVQPVAGTAAELFYKRLFEIDPALRALFKRDMKEQGQKFIQVLAVAVSGLSNTATLLPVIQQLGVRHIAYGVRPEHYDSLRQALMWTLALVLQDAYTEEVRSAWATAYAMLAGVMKEAAWGVP